MNTFTNYINILKAAGFITKRVSESFYAFLKALDVGISPVYVNFPSAFRNIFKLLPTNLGSSFVKGLEAF